MQERRKFLLLVTGALAGVAAIFASLPFFGALSPPKNTERREKFRIIDFSDLSEGQSFSVPIERKPLLVLKRSSTQIRALRQSNSDLLDPSSENSNQPDTVDVNIRSKRDDIFVAWNVCTHLRCAVNTIPENDERFVTVFPKTGGFFCPCHGAKYDNAGRVYKKGPAPKNLKIPEYSFIDETNLRVEY